MKSPIDTYISSFPEEVQEKLTSVCNLIRKEVKEGTEECISYGIPTFKYNGKYVVYFAGFKKHISLYPVFASMGEELPESKQYMKGKGTLQFPLNEELPLPLIRKLVKIMVKENLAKTIKKLV